MKIMLVLLLGGLFVAPSLFAKEGKMLAFVSKTNAGFEKDVKKNLNKDSRRTKTELSIQALDKLLSSNVDDYDKVAVIAYVSDLQGPLLSKLRELQSAEPNKYAIWLTYKGKQAPKTPSGIDATSSASEQSYSEKGYGMRIVPHLFK